MSSIYGASILKPGKLLKSIWPLLPKSGLHQWWKSIKNELSSECDSWKGNANRFNNILKGVSCIGLTLLSAKLLPRYTEIDFDNIGRLTKDPAWARLGALTVENYIGFVMASNGSDPLIETALKIQRGGTSSLPLDTGQGQMLGVVELRKPTD
jgi:hypothetical protein